MGTRDKREGRKRAGAKKRAEKRASGDRSTVRAPDNMSFMKLKEGSRKIDILEYKVGKGNPVASPGEYHFERTFFIHRNVGPSQDAVVCPRKTAGKECYICQHIAKLSKSDDVDEQLVKDLLPKERQLFQVYDHSEPDKGLQLLEISYHNFGKRLDAEIRDAEDDEDIDAFAAPDESGKTLKLGVVDDSFGGTSFQKVDTIKFLTRKAPVPDEIQEQVVCLDDLLIVPSYEETKKRFLAEDEEAEDEDEDKEETDEEDEDEKPSKKSSKKQDDDDEDEDETPPKKKKSSKDDDEDDEDDEDDSESDDDEDEDDEDNSEVEAKYLKRKVKYTYKKEKRSGKVYKVVNGLLHIKETNGEKRVMDPDEVTLIKVPQQEDDDEGEDNDESEKSSKSSKDSKKTSGKSSSKSGKDSDDDEDDIPFDDDEDEDDDD